MVYISIISLSQTSRWSCYSKKIFGCFPFSPKFRKFRLEIKWNGPFRFGPTRIFGNAFEAGPIWPVRLFRSVEPKCPLPFDKIIVPSTCLPLFCILLARTISKRVHLFKNCRLLSAALIFCKPNINAYDSKKHLYSPPPPPPRSATHAHTPVTDTQTLKTFLWKRGPRDLLAHEPLNSLLMYAMGNFPFTFV